MKAITYEQKTFIKTSLRKLGVNPQFEGFRAIQQIIFIAYKNDIDAINLEQLYRILSEKNNVTPKAVKSAMIRSFDSINTKKLLNNYEDIFKLEFDTEYFSLLTLVNDFVDLLISLE